MFIVRAIQEIKYSEYVHAYHFFYKNDYLAYFYDSTLTLKQQGLTI